jgi:hypothetical protein
MNGKYMVLLTLASGLVLLTPVATAHPSATKQRVVISMRGLPNGKFVLTALRPLRGRGLEYDSGGVSVVSADHQPRIVIRDGQYAKIYKPVVWRLEGKRGTLTIREPRNEWVDAGGAAIATGTWKVLRGTGVYVGVTGGGRSAHAGLKENWYAQQEGYLTVP